MLTCVMRPAGLVRITAILADQSLLRGDHGLHHGPLWHKFRPRTESFEAPIQLFRWEPANLARGCRQ